MTNPGLRSSTLPALNILVVDDSRLNQRLATLLFSVLGQECDTAAGGIEAVERAGAMSYDLILMDLQMPDLNGIDATLRIREEISSDAQPLIVAMTQTPADILRDRCLRCGMDDYIAKPLTFEALELVMMRAISQRDARDEARDEAPSGIDPEIFAIFRQTFEDADRDAIHDIAHDFLFNLDESRQQMRTAIIEMDAWTLTRLSHSLKSSSRWIGARRLSGLCSRIETIARTGRYSDAEPILSLIDSESALIRLELDRELPR